MRKIRVFGPRIVFFGILAVGVFGLLTSFLWNELMPAIFGLPAISFWQALGLLILGRLLLGGFGGRGHGFRKPRVVGGWKDLTPDERTRFRAAMGDRCPEAFAEGAETDKT